jgi:hypothetical protein
MVFTLAYYGPDADFLLVQLLTLSSWASAMSYVVRSAVYNASF